LRNLIVEGFRKTIARFRDKVSFVADRLGTKGIADLERLSTALYVRLRSSEASVRERAQGIMELKPHIPALLAEQAVREVDAMLQESRAVREG